MPLPVQNELELSIALLVEKVLTSQPALIGSLVSSLGDEARGKLPPSLNLSQAPARPTPAACVSGWEAGPDGLPLLRNTTLDSAFEAANFALNPPKFQL